jgi:hypothetical protein
MDEIHRLKSILDNAIKEFAQLRTVIEEWSSRVKDLETENAILLKMLEDLVNKLDEIGENEDFKGIWSFLDAHNYSYKGPHYGKELKEAKEIILVMKE